MELRDYLKVLRRRWISIVLITAACAGAAVLVTALQTPMYASNARLFVSTSEKDAATAAAGGQFSTQRVKSYADLVGSRELANRVITDLGIEANVEDVAAQVTAEVGVETVNLTLTVTDTDPREAQQIAQVYAEQLVDLVRELETPPGAANAPIKATIVDSASRSESPVSPDPVRNVGLGLIVGLLIGFGLAVVREIFDTRVTSPTDLADMTDAPVLGTIVQDPMGDTAPLLTQIESHAPRAESFRVLRTNLQFVDVDGKRKVFALTSALPAEGKTSTAVNLALSLAAGGTRTLLVECDLRRPKVPGRLGLDDAAGVTGVLLGRIKAEDAVQVHDNSGLHVIVAGTIPPNPAELLQSNAMAELLKQVREDYDVVILDAPPLLPVTDAALLAAKADGALLVVNHGKTTRDQVRLSIDRLDQVDADLIGVVLNRVPSKGKSYGYGYGYAPETTPDASHAVGRG